MTVSLESRIVELSSSDPAQVAAAAEALAQLGPSAQAAAAALVRTCGHEDATARAWTAAALEELGPPPHAQIHELIQLADDESPDAAYWAVTLLGRAGEAAATAVPTLRRILRQAQNLAVRERAAWALGKLGPVAAAAVPALHEVAASDHARLSRLARNALAAITS